MFDRESLLALLGPMPEKSALSLQVIEEVDCGRFVRRKISYLVEAEERVNAYLCLPKNERRPLPAVFCHHQHNSNWSLGKSEVVGLAGSPDQAYAKELAKQGYITLSPDAICFEERAHKEDPRGYHSWQLNQRLINGETLLGKTLWDISVGIDLLTGLPEVDENRIGFIGHSYGGRVRRVSRGGLHWSHLARRDWPLGCGRRLGRNRRPRLAVCSLITIVRAPGARWAPVKHAEVGGYNTNIDLRGEWEPRMLSVWRAWRA